MSTESGPPVRSRAPAVDAARGGAIVVMIAVNFASRPLAHAHPVFEHVPWHGLRFADAIFPLFLVLVGVSLGLRTTAPSWSRIARRTLLLFGLGLLLNAVPRFDLENLRVLGVLQRIAMAYGAAAAVTKLVGIGGQALTALTLPALQWWLSVVPSVPAVGRPTWEREQSVAAWVDRAVLGASHGYHGTFPDPEGLLGTLGAIATVLCGVLMARSVRRADEAPVLVALGIGAGLLALAGWALHPVVPVNKALWTPSFVLVTAGWSAAVLTVLLALERTPLRHVQRPFAVLGRNALVVYLSAELTRYTLRGIPATATTSQLDRLIGWFTAQAGGEVAGGLLFSGTVLAACWLLAALLAWRRVTIRL